MNLFSVLPVRQPLAAWWVYNSDIRHGDSMISTYVQQAAVRTAARWYYSRRGPDLRVRGYLCRCAKHKTMFQSFCIIFPGAAGLPCTLSPVTSSFSHRGADTKRGLVGHLTARLRRVKCRRIYGRDWPPGRRQCMANYAGLVYCGSRLHWTKSGCVGLHGTGACA